MSDYFISREKASDDLLACAAFLAERIKSSDGQGEAMNAVIPKYLARGNVDLAAELANAVEEPFSRDKLLIAVAQKCAEVDDVDYAMQLADAVEDQAMRAQAAETVALVRAGKKDFTKAFEIADTSIHPDFIYAGIAVNQAAEGDTAAADATLERIAFPTATVSALLQMAAAAVAANDTEKAVGLLDRAITTAGDIEHDEEKIRCYCDIGTLFIDAKRNDRAIETFDTARGFAELLDNIHRDFFLVNCALGFLSAGSSELADRTLDLVTDKTQMASALVGFAREYWKKDEKEDAIDAIDEAYEILISQRDKETRDSRARDNLHASIAVQFAGFGKTDRGTEIALENRNPDEQMAALAQIAQILTVQKEDELARQTINLIGEDANRLFALIAISEAKNNLGEIDASIALLEEAAELAETVHQHASRSNVLNELAERFAAHDLPEKARNISLTNLAVIAQIKDESSQAAALASLADVYDRADLELGEDEKQIIYSMEQKAEW